MRPSRPLLPLLALFWLAAPLQAQYVSTWDPDADGDNVIGVNDLLALLSVFEEVDSDGDGIFDSQDDCVGVYDPCGECNGTGLDADTDGICDNLDPCVGALDECGVCNGPGPSVPILDEIIYATDSVFLPPVGTWYVFSYAVDTLYTYICPVLGCTDAQALNFNPLAEIEDDSCTYGPAQCGGQSTVTFDGYTYALVGIGTQCWFKENLRSDSYRNGDAIARYLNEFQWNNTTAGAQTVYGEGSSEVYDGSGDEVTNLATYGRLYNWYATQDSRGLCPEDFHAASDADWMTLEITLGMSQVQANEWDWRGTDQGTQIKSSPTDTTSWDGSNATGFTGLPAGYLDANGNFSNQGYSGFWWSSSAYGGEAIYRFLYSGIYNVYRDYSVPRSGFSVRCVRDEEIGLCFDPDNDGVCAEEEISGCTNTEASNFNPEATEHDDSCEFPSPAQCGGQSTVTFDGYTYALVGIGPQCWFKENLRSDHYRNGDVIPGNLTASQWSTTTAGAQAVYGEGSSPVYGGSGDEAENISTSGRLYNWYATQDSRGLCPTGFHVPSDGEWKTLEMVLGMTQWQANNWDWRGTDQGTQMKASPWDSPSWDGSNTSGFRGLPAGLRNSIGHFHNQGTSGNWWSSSPNGGGAVHRNLSSGYSEVSRYGLSNLREGFSVRCIKD